MNFLIYFLLISQFLITISEADSTSLKEYIQWIVRSGSSSNIIDSYDHSLVLLKKGLLCKTKTLIVWKGIYDNDVPVALKITWGDGIRFMEDEMRIYHALNATNDLNIESNRIPRIYYSGNVFEESRGFAMTLFDGTLQDRFFAYKRQKRRISYFSILMIFMQAVEVLEFLHSKRVIHNDIKPANIFLRGGEVFIGDFDLATLNGYQIPDCTEQFASTNSFANRSRYAMDDIESLLFTMWHVAGMPPDESGKHAGLVLLESIQGGYAEHYLMEKCKFFEDTDVKGAFQYICVKHILSRSQIPNYKDIIHELKTAMDKVSRKTGQMEFEWLAEGSPA